MNKQNNFGRVVRIRVSPVNCMSCVDIVRLVELNPDPMSFANVVSLALNIGLEAMRVNKVLPTRDGFEYNQMITSIWGQDVKADRKRKVNLTKAFEVHVPAALTNMRPSREMELKKARFQELAFKVNQDEVNMDQAERDELQELVHELNPL